MRLTVAAAVYDGLLAFEYGLAREILGRDRSDLAADWYDFLPCRVEPGSLTTSHGMVFEPRGSLEDLAAADIVLVAGWREPLERPPAAFLEALSVAHERGGHLVTICTGSFVPAWAGLLDDRRVTTHWMHAPTMAERFPRVRLSVDALYVRDDSGPGPISTSAGSAAGLDLSLALVREHFGIAVANAVARRMVAPAHREGGQTQYAEAPAAGRDDSAMGPLLDWLVEHLDQPLRLEEVASKFGLSGRTLQRRFREQTGDSPHRWLVSQRLGRARELLESTGLSVERVATESGLGSAANLRKHMARQLGTTPRAYRTAFRAGD